MQTTVARAPSPRRFLVFALLALAGASLTAQESLEAYNIRRERVTRTAMTVLASWSAVNLTAGTILSFTADDPERAAFHQMNAGWNVVNAALAVPSLIGSARRIEQAPSLDLTESLVAQNRIEDTLLFNAGIDVGYVAAGFYLTERARRGGPEAARLAGFGRSLIVQGGFLFAFDIAVYALQRSIGRDIAELAGRR